MDMPALEELLKTARLFPEERLELVSMIGRIKRLEVIEKDAIALVDALPTCTPKQLSVALKKLKSRVR